MKKIKVWNTTKADKQLADILVKSMTGTQWHALANYLKNPYPCTLKKNKEVGGE